MAAASEFSEAGTGIPFSEEFGFDEGKCEMEDATSGPDATAGSLQEETADTKQRDTVPLWNCRKLESVFYVHELADFASSAFADAVFETIAPRVVMLRYRAKSKKDPRKKAFYSASGFVIIVGDRVCIWTSKHVLRHFSVPENSLTDMELIFNFHHPDGRVHFGECVEYRLKAEDLVGDSPCRLLGPKQVSDTALLDYCGDFAALVLSEGVVRHLHEEKRLRTDTWTNQSFTPESDSVRFSFNQDMGSTTGVMCIGHPKGTYMTVSFGTHCALHEGTTTDALQGKADALRGKADTLHGKADALRGKADTLQGKVDTLHGKADAPRGKADTLQGKADTLHGKADALRGKADTLQGKADTLHGKADALRGKADTLQGKADALRGKADTLHGKADTLHGKADALRGKADTLHGKADALQGKADALRGKADALHAKADTLHGKADTLHGKADALRGKADTLQGKADTLQSKANAQYGRCSKTYASSSGMSGSGVFGLPCGLEELRTLKGSSTSFTWLIGLHSTGGRNKVKSDSARRKGTFVRSDVVAKIIRSFELQLEKRE